MKTTFKRFGVWVTDLRANLFIWARLKLTALYLFIIVIMLAIYSAAFYFSVIQNVRARINAAGDRLGAHQLYDSATDALQEQIIIIDSVIFLLAGIGSFWLSEKTLRPVKRAYEAQERFSADASHEFRTPLAVMKTTIEVLLRGKEVLSPETKRVLQSTLEEIQSLATITDDLLDLARDTLTAMHIVDVSSIIKKVVESLTAIAREKNLVIALDGLPKAEIKGNTDALIRLYKNIFSNAISYTPVGGSIRIAMDTKGDFLTTKISDNGIGINEKELDKIFNRFYKADNARSSSGTGLGLAIAKHIAVLHHGAITIESSVGKGTTVTISFPLHHTSSKLHTETI
ncbi:MAG TPA: HAMP domain-containing sensor histidine kinase [Candidatus Paceibacterota bacterium]|nr:HAMP domain-containing sensor histidine kinase [Candidatus Paceibacterota bacterium]